ARCVAADPQRRPRPPVEGAALHGHRPLRVAAGGEAVTVERHRLAGPRRAQRAQGLVRALVARCEVGAERRELACEVAGGDAQHEAPAREHVERRGRLRDQERVAIGQHQHVGEQAQARGRRGRERERDEGIERVVAAGRHPARGRHRMIRHAHRVEARRLRGARHLGDRFRRQQFGPGVDPIGRKLNGEAHGDIRYAAFRSAKPREDPVELRYSEADERFRRELREWLAAAGPKHGPPPPAHDWPARVAYDTGWQRRLFDAGYAGISWPAAYGGRDLSATEQLVYYEEYARAGAPYVGVNFVGLLHGGP